jgi:hypothetical protein
MQPPAVVTGLVPVIHVFLLVASEGVDGRNKSGHDLEQRAF